METPVKPMEQRLAWLGGILDGEGCISAAVITRPRVKGKQRNTLTPVVHIGNTEVRIINECAAIADALGLHYFLHKRKHQSQRLPFWQIIFAKGPRVEALLVTIIPYLVGKRDQAELLLRLVRHRRGMGRNSGQDAIGRLLGPVPVMQDAEALVMVQNLKDLKRFQVMTEN